VTFDPGFKVTIYLQVEYLADGASFQLYKAQITRGSTETVQKIGIVAEFILIKPLEGVLHEW